MDTAVHQHRELVRYSLRHAKAMETAKHWTDVVVWTEVEGELSCCIPDCLETIYVERRNSGHCGICSFVISNAATTDWKAE